MERQEDEEELRQLLLWSRVTGMKRQTGSVVSLWRKYTLFFINFFIFLLTGAVIGLMTWILVVKEKKVKNAYDFFLDPSCVLLLVGCVGFVTSFFGWIGSLREIVGALSAYRWIMTILFLVEMVFVVLIFVVVYVPDARQQLNIYPEDTLKTAIIKYRDDPDMQDLIDGIQLELECCGTSNDDVGYKEWSQNAYFNCSTATETKDFGEFCSVPFSCCIKKNNGLVNIMCGKDMQKPDTDPIELANTIHTRGCFKAITTILHENVLVVGGVLIGIFIPQIFLMSLSGKLIGQIQIQLAKLERSIRQEQQLQRLQGHQ